MANPEMIERAEPRHVKFVTGEVIDGILVSIERRVVDDKPGIYYTVLESDGTSVGFWGTHQLNTKLRPTDRGHHVSIRCEGTDTMIGRNGNNMKVFKVLVSKDLAKDGELYITDDDIPF